MTTYKPLAEAFNKNSFRYELLARTDTMALYSQSDAETGHLVAHEVCRVLRHEGRMIGATYVPPAEYLPGSEQWGSQAWTLKDAAAAWAKYQEQVTLLAARAAA